MPRTNTFLDYGGLIFNYEFNRQTLLRAHNIALDSINSEGFPVGLIELANTHDDVINDYLKARQDCTEWSIEQIIRLMLRRLGINSADLSSQLSEIYKLNDHDATPKGDAKRILTDLAKTRKLGIISNLPHDSLLSELEEYGMRELFDTITISYQVGVRKPHKDIYLEAMRRARAFPENSLFVSHDEIEVIGAREVGMEAVLTDSLEEVIGVI